MKKSEVEQLLVGIKAFEQTFKCHVTIYDYSGHLKQEIHRLPFFHLNPFCTRFKDKGLTLTSTCIAFDLNTVQQRLAEQHKAFLKYCHCNLLEVVIPVFIASKLSGAMFIGPFRWYNDLLPPEVLRSKGRGIKNSIMQSSIKSLPVIDYALAGQIIGIAQIICSNIDKSISQKKQLAVAVSGCRREKITAFLDEHFTKNISLADLAHDLMLSESRTSQLVKELFNMNFPELLTRRRLEHAKSLLEHSMFNLETIAGYSGFRDVAYFHRVFRKFNRQSPGHYRKAIRSSN